jgi:hypothetical protein
MPPTRSRFNVEGIWPYENRACRRNRNNS